MDYMDCMLALYKGTKRQGPGTDEATKKALGYVKLPSKAKILDIGCGAGAQTMTLLNNTKADVTAVDFFQEFLDPLYNNAKEAGFKERLKTIRGDMNALNFPDREFDLIWSEGAIYIMGFEKGIRDWKRYLKSGGYLVVSEATFLKNELPAELESFWKNAYSPMGTVESNKEAAMRQGYTVIADFPLGKQGWVDYYEPLKTNLEAFAKKYKNGDALQLIKETKEEIEIFEKYFDYYDYCFYVMKKNI